MRIIIPFIDTDGEWFGFQGRSLDFNDKLRYITIMLDEESYQGIWSEQSNSTKQFTLYRRTFR